MITIKYNKKSFHVDRSLLVLISVFTAIMVMPFFEGLNAESIFVTLLLTVICILEIYSDTKVVFFYRTQLLFGVASIVFAWMARLSFLPGSLDFIEHLLFTLFFFNATIGTIHKIVHCIKLNSDTIFNAINGYLFLGLFGASFASVLEIFQLDAFQFAATITNFQEFEKFIYYSFVTLTTVGYGDIIPVSSGAKVLTIFLSVSGQLYLTVLIGLIIGKYVAKMSMQMKGRQ